MFARIALILTAAVLAGSLVACAANPAPPAPAPADGAAGSKLAPGAYVMQDGSTQLLGDLEYRDIEGGTWLITGGSQAEGTQGTVFGVIANADELAPKLKQLKGKQVIAVGAKVDGVSVRMAGPEYEITQIDAVSDTGNPAAE